MCDQKEFSCVGCGQTFGNDGDQAIRHVEELHANEFSPRDLDSTEAAVERLISPSPLVE